MVKNRIVCGNLGIYVRLFPVQTADRVLQETSPVTQLKTCNKNMALIMMNSVIPCTKQHQENKRLILYIFLITPSEK